MHPCLGAVDHICFHPLTQGYLHHIAARPRRSCGRRHGRQAPRLLPDPLLFSFRSLPRLDSKGELDVVPTFLYGATHWEGERWPPSRGSSATSSQTPPMINGGEHRRRATCLSPRTPAWRGHRDPRAWCSFPVTSFTGNDELCGAPLPRSSSCRAPRRLRLLGAEVSIIVAAIAVVSATVCVVLLYIMLRMWSN
ncbi:hypothetical protein GUJ93_ZPchr0008g13520 [Zizania palustris]|uniref:Uncharacterized protein n=1 Tax=Zizania palustris TaxID=103762 RepID=A0A8J5QZK1_ZIZPA|nr:hypothetical protein GUJ93_ZPchr0008g13520 [Zizania palustris]